MVILKDTNGNRSHAVGIDVGKQLIYDCMEDKSLVLNVDNLSICCGSDVVFQSILTGCELKTKFRRLKKLKNVVMFDSVQCQFDTLFFLIEI